MANLNRAESKYQSRYECYGRPGLPGASRGLQRRNPVDFPAYPTEYLQSITSVSDEYHLGISPRMDVVAPVDKKKRRKKVDCALARHQHRAAMAMAMTSIAALPVSNRSLTLRPHGAGAAPQPGLISASRTRFFCADVQVSAFCRPQAWRENHVRSITCQSKNETKTPPTADASPLVKMAWYGSEAFGKFVAAFRPSSASSEAEDEEVYVGPVPRSEAVELIRKDYERSYFVTGNMCMGIYEADCEFADPFVSFKGLKRFKQNVSNLGSFMEESSLKITDWQEYEDRIYAKWRFNCVLGLPWHPILAASGSTEYFFDSNSGKICKHVENWDISPADGVRQLFKPNPKRKKNNS